MTLDVLICTFGRGICDITKVTTAPRNNVRYVVSFQYEDSTDLDLIPDVLQQRADVTLLKMQGRGLSVNRNNAMAAATGDIMIFADDDNRYTLADFDRIISVFENNPDIDIACFRSTNYDGTLCRNFPLQTFNLSAAPSGYYARSCEIAVRRSRCMPRFDERFGIGAEYLACGEEEVFIHECLRSGFKAFYYPSAIVRTASRSTGAQFTENAAVRRSKGAVLATIHGGFSARLRVAKYAMFHVHGMSRLVALRDMLDGVSYAEKKARC